MKVPRGFTLTADHRPRVNDTNKLDQHYISITFVQPLITRDSRGDANWETNERSLWYYWSSCLTILHGSLPFSSYPFSDAQRSRFLDTILRDTNHFSTNCKSNIFHCYRLFILEIMVLVYFVFSTCIGSWKSFDIFFIYFWTFHFFIFNEIFRFLIFIFFNQNIALRRRVFFLVFFFFK